MAYVNGSTQQLDIPRGEILHGWEARTMYVVCEGTTRGQAKALVAWDVAMPFTDIRCRRIWLCFKELTEQEAEDAWVEEWRPGYKAWIGCKRTDEGAVAWWEVTWPRD